MRIQKSSKKKLRKLLARQRPRRRRLGQTVNLERASNQAVIKLQRRIDRLRQVTHEQARQLAAETLRSTARKYRFAEGTDEFRHMRSCLLEKADQRTGHYHPELYEI